jgi:hypothetical protein
LHHDAGRVDRYEPRGAARAKVLNRCRVGAGGRLALMAERDPQSVPALVHEELVLRVHIIAFEGGLDDRESHILST